MDVSEIPWTFLNGDFKFYKLKILITNTGLNDLHILPAALLVSKEHSFLIIVKEISIPIAQSGVQWRCLPAMGLT